jgi:drug/metabolite transporter (DMT)-like permease
VLFWSHLVGLVLVLASLPIVGADPRAADLGLGVLGGLAGAAGVGLLYQALGIGPMSVVAPTTALLAAVVPVVAGLIEGERPSAGVGVGMALALAAIVLVAAEGEGSLKPADPRSLLFALGAGLGFGLFFVALSHTGDDAGTWPLLGARATSVTAVGVLALLGRVRPHLPEGARALTVTAGTLDVTANLLYLLAVRDGLLSVVSVLVALYPVSTVVLARVVLRERFASLQRVGMVLALPATILIAR